MFYFANNRTRNLDMIDNKVVVHTRTSLTESLLYAIAICYSFLNAISVLIELNSITMRLYNFYENYKHSGVFSSHNNFIKFKYRKSSLFNLKRFALRFEFSFYLRLCLVLIQLAIVLFSIDILE